MNRKRKRKYQQGYREHKRRKTVSKKNSGLGNDYDAVKDMLQEDGYKVLHKIAESMVGTVLKVLDETTGNEVALKVLKQEHAKYLRTEINILTNLDHPNIIRLHCIKKIDGWMYANLEYCQYDLMDLLRLKNFEVSEEAVANIMFQIFHALSYLHSRNIVHRDLKLRNVCVVGEKNLHKALVKIIDFGLSVQYRTGDWLEKPQGTRHFMCPEMCEGRKYGPGCDVWGAGVIMHILLCGKRPFKGTDWKELKKSIVLDHISFSNSRWRKISRHAKELVMELLSKSPKYRIDSKNLCQHKWCKEFAPQMKGTFEKKKIQLLKRLENFVSLDSQEMSRRVRLAPMISCQNRIVEHHSRMFTALERTGKSLLADNQIGVKKKDIEKARHLRFKMPHLRRISFSVYLAIVLDANLFDELEKRMIAHKFKSSDGQQPNGLKYLKKKVANETSEFYIPETVEK